MITIKIREYGDEVYFLSPNGFKKGMVKRAVFNSEIIQVKKVNTLIYFVTEPKCNPEFQGYEKREDELFDSKEEMIAYYSTAKL